MQLYRTTLGFFLQKGDRFYQLPVEHWDNLINRDDLFEYLDALDTNELSVQTTLESGMIQAPIEGQEVWAAGVTYYRSKQARMEESANSGGSSFYDKVYDADRPELFFKALARQTVGTNGNLRIRKDANWNVPEPELTFFVTANAKIVAYTIGNDMSARDIEGENPLYLPQAKCYDKCAGLGPCLYVTPTPLDPSTVIQLQIKRQGAVVFEGNTQVSQIKRTPTELVDYLFRENSFPKGCFLMTGTGIVPPDHFTLAIGDEVLISIPPIGILRNVIEH